MNVLTDWLVFFIFSQAILKTRSTSVTKDELFTLEDSLAQAVFVSVMNGRHVSVKQGSFYSAQFYTRLADQLLRVKRSQPWTFSAEIVIFFKRLFEAALP
jgi:hypothetical protein